jgi:transposase InsO family protein
MEQVKMNRIDRERMVILSRVKDKQLRRGEAAEVLGLSLRQVHRLFLRYKAQGDAGLLHRGRGRASNRRIAKADRDRAFTLYREHYSGSEGYAGFGPTFFAEKLGTLHGLYVSHDTARRWMIGWGVLTEDLCRRRRSRKRRIRKSRFGEMVQMDGSEHDWFEGRGPRCVLMVMVDDATGKKLVRFYKGETVSAAMDMMNRWCTSHGVPASLYVDRAGIYRSDRDPTPEEIKGRNQPMTQFGRAMKELDVRLILARSPQAKGRVERANGTLQDRLVKEMRLKKICSIDDANTWLATGEFLADLNVRQSIGAMDPVDAHRPLVVNLSEVLCLKEKRTVSNDSCVQFSGQTLQLELLQGRVQPRVVEVWFNAANGAVESIRSGSLSWPWKALAQRPKKPTAPPVRSHVGVAHKPTQKMKRQISNLFNRREPRPAERLKKIG